MTEKDTASLLVETQLLTPEDLEKALQAQQRLGGSLEMHALEMGLATEEQWLWALSALHGIPNAHPWDIQHIPTHMAQALPKTTAEAYNVLPFCSHDGSITVITHKAPDPFLTKRLEKETHQNIHYAISTAIRIQEGLHQLYKTPLTPRTQKLLQQLHTASSHNPQPTHTVLPVIDWDRRLQRIRNTPLASAVFTELLACTEEATGFAALFQCTPTHMQCFRSTAGIADNTPSNLHIPLDLPSLFAYSYHTQNPFYGEVPYNSVNHKCLAALQRSTSCTALAIPVLCGKTVVAVLYCDNQHSALVPSHKEALVNICKEAGLHLHHLHQKSTQALSCMDAITESLQPLQTAHTLEKTEPKPQPLTKASPSTAEMIQQATLLLQAPQATQRLLALEYFNTHLSHAPLTNIAQRLHDKDPMVRTQALSIIRQHPHHTVYACVLENLLELLHFPDTAIQVNAMIFLAELRDPQAVPWIIPFTASPWEPLYTTAVCALTLLCLRNEGKNHLKWETFWHNHGHEHRQQWIQEALQSPNPALQALAEKERMIQPKVIKNISHAAA
jgi:hypothetical protein